MLLGVEGFFGQYFQALVRKFSRHRWQLLWITVLLLGFCSQTLSFKLDGNFHGCFLLGL